MSQLEWVGYLSIIFNTHSPNVSLPAVKPMSLHVDLAFSNLDEDVTGVEVEDAVALGTLFLEVSAFLVSSLAFPSYFQHLNLLPLM